MGAARPARRWRYANLIDDPRFRFPSEGDAASYDLRSGAVSRIAFEEGALVVKTPGGEVRAKAVP